MTGAATTGAATTDAPDRPDVSVVVCAYTMDRWPDLRRAIRSVREQSEQAREVIVVADHCPALLRRARRTMPDVISIPNGSERGLSGSRNTGAAKARGAVVAFIDDDAAADPGWLAGLADGYRDPRVLGVGGLVRPEWAAGRPAWFPPELDWVVGCSHRGMPAVSATVRNFIGANMSFRRDVLDGSGGFSGRLGRVGSTPLGCEETELCLRVSGDHPDGILLYDPAASVRHKVPEQRATWRYLCSRCYAEGLSKATVSRMAGARRGLSAERSYLSSTVPRGLAGSLARAARGQRGELLSAAALVTAVLVTSAGYLRGRVTGSRAAFESWLCVAGLAACLALWACGLATADVARLPVSWLGLVSVLPVTFWAALAVLMASFAWSVTREGVRWPLLAAHLVMLVAILHATPAILYGTLRYSWAWKHVGVVDYIARHGIDFRLGGVLGIYQDWPGFFALNAFLTTGSGLRTALGYAPWVLPLNDLLWLAPVMLIARAFTADRRLIWTAAWLFELGNWVGQDYFSPQAFAFFLYLTVIAVCLRWLWHPRIGPPPSAGAGTDREPPRTWVLVLALVAPMAAIASSHQLTPFMLLGALTLLVLFRQVRPRGLPVLMAVITAGWIGYGGLPWLEANRAQVLRGLGDPWGNTAAHLVGQGQVPTGQIVVDWGARGVSAAIGLLAVAGYIRFRRHGDARSRRSWDRLAVLAAAAVPAVAASSYGGEIIFRVYLFALPFMAIAAAAAFFPHPAAGRSPALAAVLAVAAMELAVGFALGNYGQEAVNYFTPQEVAAASWLYRTAPPGTLVVAADNNFPWAFVHYNWYGYAFLDAPASFSKTVLRAPVTAIARVMGHNGTRPSYLILTASQAAAIRLTGTWPPAAYQRVRQAVLASPRFRVVYRNDDASILRLVR
jgi:hypothetical protein